MLVAARIPPPCVLVGHSFGGMVMRLLAARHPELAAALVLIEPAHAEDWTDPSPERRQTIERGAAHVDRGGLTGTDGGGNGSGGLERHLTEAASSTKYTRHLEKAGTAIRVRRLREGVRVRQTGLRRILAPGTQRSERMGGGRHSRRRHGLHLFRVGQEAGKLRRHPRLFVVRQLDTRQLRDALDVFAGELSRHGRNRSTAEFAPSGQRKDLAAGRLPR